MEHELAAAIDLCEAAAGSENERAQLFKRLRSAEFIGVHEKDIALALEWLAEGSAIARAEGYARGRADAAGVALNLTAVNALQAKYDALVAAARDVVNAHEGGAIDALVKVLS